MRLTPFWTAEADPKVRETLCPNCGHKIVYHRRPTAKPDWPVICRETIIRVDKLLDTCKCEYMDDNIKDA